MYLCVRRPGRRRGRAGRPGARVPGRIPAGARVVTVTLVSGFESGPGRGGPGDAATITDPAAVATIAAVTGGLRQLPDSTYSCPAEAGPAMMLAAMQLTVRTAPRRPRWSPPWAPII